MRSDEFKLIIKFNNKFVYSKETDEPFSFEVHSSASSNKNEYSIDENEANINSKESNLAESEESLEESSEDEQESSDNDEESKVNVIQKVIEKSVMFQSEEQDEISGEILPSVNNHNNNFSSVLNDISEVCEHEERDKMSFRNSSRRENKVGVPRRSTINTDAKIWTIEEDEILIHVTSKYKAKSDALNWSRIGKELNNFKNNKSFIKRTPQDWMKHFHDLQKKLVDSDWTSKEVQTMLELHKKYGNKWQLISKKMTGKTDKQIMYKFDWIQQGKQKNEEKPQNIKYGADEYVTLKIVFFFK